MPRCPGGSRSPAGRGWTGSAAAWQGTCTVPPCMEGLAQGNLLAERVGGSLWGVPTCSLGVLTVAKGCCADCLPALGRLRCALAGGSPGSGSLRMKRKERKGGQGWGHSSRTWLAGRESWRCCKESGEERQVGGQVMDWKGKKPLRG